VLPCFVAAFEVGRRCTRTALTGCGHLPSRHTHRRWSPPFTHAPADTLSSLCTVDVFFFAPSGPCCKAGWPVIRTRWTREVAPCVGDDSNGVHPRSELAVQGIEINTLRGRLFFVFNPRFVHICVCILGRKGRKPITLFQLPVATDWDYCELNIHLFNLRGSGSRHCGTFWENLICWRHWIPFRIYMQPMPLNAINQLIRRNKREREGQLGQLGPLNEVLSL
jgi:hypothetical protein